MASLTSCEGNKYNCSVEDNKKKKTLTGNLSVIDVWTRGSLSGPKRAKGDRSLHLGVKYEGGLAYLPHRDSLRVTAALSSEGCRETDITHRKSYCLAI